MISKFSGKDMKEHIVTPKVTLVAWTREPEKAIHAFTQNMFGNMITDLDKVDPSEVNHTIDELCKTSFGGPLECVDFEFQIEFVPRAFTHQAVRTRVGAVYSQESLRFSVKNEGQFDFAVGPSVKTEEQLSCYLETMEMIQERYNKLIDLGVAPEDARGVLPINISTKIGIKYNLMTLMKVAEVRLCTQSQSHWANILRQMKKEIHDKVSPKLASLLKVYCEKHNKCGYLSEYDRSCPIQLKFEGGKAVNEKV